jgi:hypothetical protein
MTADLAEEHSTSTLATERLEAETADRLRLEKELQDVQVRIYAQSLSCCLASFFILQTKISACTVGAFQPR